MVKRKRRWRTWRTPRPRPRKGRCACTICFSYYSLMIQRWKTNSYYSKTLCTPITIHTSKVLRNCKKTTYFYSNPQWVHSKPTGLPKTMQKRIFKNNMKNHAAENHLHISLLLLLHHQRPFLFQQRYHLFPFSFIAHFML